MRVVSNFALCQNSQMTTISIIGSGNMATAIGTRAANHGHTIEFMSRSSRSKAHRLPENSF